MEFYVDLCYTTIYEFQGNVVKFQIYLEVCRRLGIIFLDLVALHRENYGNMPLTCSS